jgi:hypothetical protein
LTINVLPDDGKELEIVLQAALEFNHVSVKPTPTCAIAWRRAMTNRYQSGDGTISSIQSKEEIVPKSQDPNKVEDWVSRHGSGWRTIKGTG